MTNTYAVVDEHVAIGDVEREVVVPEENRSVTLSEVLPQEFIRKHNSLLAERRLDEVDMGDELLLPVTEVPGHQASSHDCRINDRWSRVG